MFLLTLYAYSVKFFNVMNIARKIYCRVFQEVFHIAIPFLPYRKPMILSSVTELPKLFKEKNIDSVLIVTDKSIRGFGITKPLEDALSANGIKATVYDGTVANPTTDNVEEARKLYIASGSEAIIGFGGGSSIDAAKAVGARIAYPKKPLSKMEGILKVLKRIPLLVAIPTTAGTGSETTLASVIVDSETRHKYPINSFPLIPRYAVLDPEVTKTLPPSVTATTGLDALTHAVEAFIGRSTTKETRRDSIEAVRLIFSNIEKVYKDGSDVEARRAMLRAAFLAGSAFTKSYVGYVHAVAHSLGGKYNTPHGLANAVLLPYVLEYYGKSSWKKLAVLADAAGIAGKSDEEKADAFIAEIRRMERELRIPTTLPEVKEEDIEELSAYADKEANPLYPVPMLMDKEELKVFYRKIMAKESKVNATA